MRFASVAEVKDQLSEYLARARKKREPIVVTHHGKPYALIQPLTEQDLEDSPRHLEGGARGPRRVPRDGGAAQDRLRAWGSRACRAAAGRAGAGRQGGAQRGPPGAGSAAPTRSLSSAADTPSKPGTTEAYSIQIGGSAFTDILAAGGTFVSGGYPRALNPSANPLAGRSVWTGDLAGYITTVVNLPASADGQQVVFRWRCGSDASVARAGWWIDGIRVITDHICQPAVCLDLIFRDGFD